MYVNFIPRVNNGLQQTPSKLQTDLQHSGDFLSITRQHPWHLNESFTFTVKRRDNTIRVSVIDTGLIMFEPVDKATTKDIVLSSGVHGNETAPIEICADLIQKLILGQQILAQRVLFIFGNPASMNIAERFVEENMNRLFSGGHSLDQGNGDGLINKERHRALLLENTVRDFYRQGSVISANRQRYHYDLHTAIRGSKNDKFAVYPFLHGKPRNKQQLQFLQASGITTILLSHSPTTTFSYFSSNEFGAHAFTVELGKVKPFGENDMSQFSEIKQSLIKLIANQEVLYAPFDQAQFDIYEIFQIIKRNNSVFTLNFADDVENFTDFPVGFVLAKDGNEDVKVKQAGEAIIFPNAEVAIGQRALLTVVPTTLD
jgi:succinylglutamate desuccinylase